MKKKLCKQAGTLLLVALWVAITLAAWLRIPEEFSASERRKLAQFPKLSTSALMDGSFMSDFESYILDQFPLRDAFRQLKARLHYDLFGRLDNNGIYLADGHAAKLEYPLDGASVENALKKFNSIYDRYLKDTGSNVILSVVPDKGCYLAAENGYPAMDYDALFAAMAQGMPWADYVNLSDTLTAEDYYYTDTHWRQEELLEAARRLSEALDIPVPNPEDYTLQQAEQPFYGVYHGQAALPMEPDVLYTLHSPMLDACTVTNHENGQTMGIYDEEKLSGLDPYEVFLSGPVSLLTIENPNAETDRELIIFRDSFGSSMAPLLMQGYKTVTLVDIRYISSAMLHRFIDFHGQDVLFLYSTLVLNNSETMQ